MSDYLGTFKLQINLGNATMSGPEAVADALELVAARLRTSTTQYPATIMDIDGNSVGSWDVETYYP